ncbi:MAG TPA: M20/M25/M40 family metallo-hydrolase [Woeseiaceae bacterium]|nr:M20/M25/M40 family metallo-hydrolase [Woeseiaceae bacterium]
MTVREWTQDRWSRKRLGCRRVPALLACMASALVLSTPVAAQHAELDANERAMAAWIDDNADDAVDLLESLVNLSSGTMNHEGVRQVGAVLRQELDDLGLATEWIELPPELNRAGHLVGRQDGTRGPRLLMIGHLDTVFEADDDFQAFRREGNIATGPGVDDMKSGDVVIVYALKALQHIGLLEDMQVVAFFTGDEEMAGRPLSVSRKHLVEAGKWADVALGFEGASFREGRDWATVARRGTSDWRLEVSGTQAHSSRVFGDSVGAGAIFEAARILNAFYEEVRGEEYLTFNAGTIQGGTDVEFDFEETRGTTFGKTNVVPRKVIVHGDMRTLSLEQLERAEKAMRAIVANHLPHTEASITFGEGYPPMAPTEGNIRLQEKMSAINQALGRGPMDALDPSFRGAADISFVAPYADGLAGLGANGRGGHTPNESLELDSIPLAVKRAAILMYRLINE